VPGSIDLNEVILATSSGTINLNVLMCSVVFIVSGLAFKLGVVPFHMWVPDVYEGSPTAVTILLGGAPKFAAFAICFRFLVEGLLPLAFGWQQMLAVLAILSMIIGNIAAIAQTNIKRMMAYSSISHMGFMLLGLLAGVVNGNLFSTANAYSSALFYIVTYVITTLAAFGVIILLSRSGFEAEKLENFKGLNQRSPWFAAIMLLIMLSLAGVPPLMGFYAKLSVLQALAGTGNQFWLILVAMLCSLIGAFYYLRVIKLMYFDDPEDRNPIIANLNFRLMLSLNGLAVLFFGLWPGWLMNITTKVIVETLASFFGRIT